MSTVLWGGRRGDVQYGSRDYWRKTIPIDPAVQVIAMHSSAYFDVGDLIDIMVSRAFHDPGQRGYEPWRVVGFDGRGGMGLVRS